MNYEGIKELKRALRQLGHKWSMPELYVMAPQNDPFLAGMGANKADAEWFTDIWKKFHFPKGTHVRRVHYKMVSAAEPVMMRNGEQYDNTINCSKLLGHASQMARYLKLVPIDQFVDRRNPEPYITLEADEEEAGLAIARNEDAYLPEAPPGLPSLDLIQVTPQRYHVEIWIEKTTANDILIPLAEEYNVNMVAAAGEISLTACYALIQRAQVIKRPVRILYASDFDMGGRDMPVSAARKLEFLIQEYAPDLDLQLRPIVLSQEQCREYKLPWMPVKESDKRAKRFKEQFGDRSTELDALEAVHEGELERLMRVELDRYYDHDLAERAEDVAAAIEDDLAGVNESVLERHTESIDDVRAEYQDVLQRYQAWRDRAEIVWQAVAKDLVDEAPDFDSYDWPVAEEGDEDPDPMFDSTRNYLGQIVWYKEFQRKPIGEFADDVDDDEGEDEEE